MPGLRHVHILRETLRARLRRTLLAAVAMTAILSGCGDDTPSEPPPSPLPVATVSIATVPDYITVGESLTLVAEVKAADGTPLNDRPVAWSSDNVALATVTNAGVVTARAPGVVAIRATSEGRTGLIDARVLAAAPAPAIETMQPASVTAGTAGPLPVRLRGIGFTDRSRIYWNGEERPTTYISATELQTMLRSSELEAAWTATVVVRTSAPGGGQSNPVTFEVADAPPAAPTITALNPAQITAGWTLGFTLTITGTNFTPLTRVEWDGATRETQFVSSTSLRVQVTPFDVRAPREIAIAVETPAPGGGRVTAVFPVRAIPVDRIDVGAPWGASWTWVNNALPLVAVPRSVTGVELTDRRAQWFSGNTAVAMTVPTGDLTTSVYGVSRGTTFIDVEVDGVRAQRPMITVYDPPPFDVVYSAGVASEQYIGLWSPWTGEAPRRLPLEVTAFQPSPSPSGSHIVFAGMPRTGSVFDANVDLYVVARDGSGLRRLTSHEAADLQPSWSPDGTQIAFASMRGGNRNVWVVNSDGTNLRQLTDAQPGAPHAGSGGSAGDPAWSPDGSKLVYGVTVGGSTTLWIMGVDGSNKRQLTLAAGGNAYDPTWSANGELIAYRREFGSPTQIGLTFVSSSDGTVALPVLTSAPMSATPAFSPDGEWLMASNSPLGNVATLYAAPLKKTGGPRVILPATLGGARSAHWIRRP